LEPRRNVRSPLGSARSTTGAHHPVWRFALDSPTRPLLVAAQIRAIIVPTPRRASAAALADGFVPLESDRLIARIRLYRSRTLIISVPFRPKRPASTGGTRSSNPLSSSRQSVSRRNSLSFVEKPGFSAGVRAGAGGAVGRDAQGVATWRQLAIISLSAYIPVPQCADAVRNSGATGPPSEFELPWDI
jgi:hypothetical protein